jgi:hypothetical protein
MDNKIFVEINPATIKRALGNMGITDVVVANKPNPFNGNITDELSKGIEDDLNGSNTKKNDLNLPTPNGVDMLLKGFTDFQTNVANQLAINKKETDTLIKGLQEKVELLGKTAGPRKSVMSNAMEKGFNGGEGLSDNEIPADVKAVLSKSKQKRAIIKILEAKANFGENDENIAKGLHNKEISKALVSFETSNILPAAILKQLREEDKIMIVE